MNNSMEVRRRGALARIGKRYKIRYCKICGTDTGNNSKEYCKDHAKQHHYDSIRESRKNNGTTNKGKFWIHNTIGEAKLLSKGNCIPEGWYKGRVAVELKSKAA